MSSKRSAWLKWRQHEGLKPKPTESHAGASHCIARPKLVQQPQPVLLTGHRMVRAHPGVGIWPTRVQLSAALPPNALEARFLLLMRVLCEANALAEQGAQQIGRHVFVTGHAREVGQFLRVVAMVE